jgi:Na+/proline symporter
LAILAYIVVQLGVGAWVSRKVRSESDYILAGRQLGFVLSTFTIFATWFGAETCVGSAGRIAENGLSGGASDPFGYALCLLLMGAVFARPLWKMKLTTFGDFFRARYGVGVERLTVLLMVPTSLLWAAAQVRAFGQVLAHAGQMEIFTTTTIAAGVVIAYTMFGGLLADAWTDLLQGIVLAAGLIVLLVLMMQDGAMSHFAEIEPAKLNPFAGEGGGFFHLLESWALPVCGSVMAAELVSRVIASKSAKVAQASALTATGMYLAVGLIPVMVGLLARPILGELPDAEHVLPAMAARYLPGFLYIVFAGALVSAILSTVDSALLVSGSLVSHNVVAPLLPAMSDRGRVWTARVFVGIFGLVAYGLALSAEGIFELVEQASGFGSAGIFVIVVVGMFSKFGGGASAMASLIAGLAVWILAANVLPARATWNESAVVSYPYLFSLAAAVIAYVAFAVISKREPVPAC